MWATLFMSQKSLKKVSKMSQKSLKVGHSSNCVVNILAACFAKNLFSLITRLCRFSKDTFCNLTSFLSRQHQRPLRPSEKRPFCLPNVPRFQNHFLSLFLRPKVSNKVSWKCVKLQREMLMTIQCVSKYEFEQLTISLVYNHQRFD